MGKNIRKNNIESSIELPTAESYFCASGWFFHSWSHNIIMYTCIYKLNWEFQWEAHSNCPSYVYLSIIDQPTQPPRYMQSHVDMEPSVKIMVLLVGVKQGGLITVV